MTRSFVLVGALLLWIGAATFSAQTANDIHFHHAHINAVDPDASVKFYADNFGGVPIKFNQRAAAVFTERSFLLFNKVASAPPAALDTGIWHLGWGGVDGPREFNSLTGKGVQFQTPVTPLGDYHYMYAFGPDKEVVEVWSGYQNHRFGHVHFIAADPVATVRWYNEKLGIPLKNPAQPVPQPGPTSAGSNALQNVDNVNLIVFRQPAAAPVPALWAGNAPIGTFQSTKGRALDHIAFSFRRIQPVFDRLKKAGVTIVEPISVKPEFGFKSFFIEGPEKVLIEIVEAKPIPDASWE